jgi:hypothetical protein
VARIPDSLPDGVRVSGAERGEDPDTPGLTALAGFTALVAPDTAGLPVLVPRGADRSRTVWDVALPEAVGLEMLRSDKRASVATPEEPGVGLLSPAGAPAMRTGSKSPVFPETSPVARPGDGALSSGTEERSAELGFVVLLPSGRVDTGPSLLRPVIQRSHESLLMLSGSALRVPAASIL